MSVMKGTCALPFTPTAPESESERDNAVTIEHPPRHIKSDGKPNGSAITKQKQHCNGLNFVLPIAGTHKD
jgi:hypothetical protein